MSGLDFIDNNYCSHISCMKLTVLGVSHHHHHLFLWRLRVRAMNMSKTSPEAVQIKERVLILPTFHAHITCESIEDEGNILINCPTSKHVMTIWWCCVVVEQSWYSIITFTPFMISFRWHSHIWRGVNWHSINFRFNNVALQWVNGMIEMWCMIELPVITY